MNNLKIRVVNDNEYIWYGTVKEFLEDNQYDELVVEMCNELKDKQQVEYHDNHSGHWVIQKI